VKTMKRRTQLARAKRSAEEDAARYAEQQHRRVLRAERRIRGLIRQIDRVMVARKRAELALALRIATDHGHDLVESERAEVVNG
jgi:hypothetical protein